MAVTLREEIACIRRELALRERVYPHQVANGRMKPAEAELELSRMRAVLARLHELQAAQDAPLCVTLAPTDTFVAVSAPGGIMGEMQSRMWRGHDQTGVELHALILRVGLSFDAPADVQARFADALRETAPLRPGITPYPNRVVL